MQPPLQAPAPLQVRPPAHSLSGSVFASTAAQVPSAPMLLAAEQATHVPEQGALQQKPSTQLPLEHSVVLEHTWPLSFLQLPAPSQLKTPVQAPGGLLSSTN